MNLLRRQLRTSRKLAKLVALRVEKGGRRVRPLPSQQEEAMKAVKTLFGYHNETSADEAQVVCYCVSIICSKLDRSSDALVALLIELSRVDVVATRPKDLNKEN